MAVQFKDYYETLGVSRTASTDEISKAYREKARKLHPDVNKAPNAEEQFKELNEAHTVLRDPEKRKRYDTLGANYQNGQDFTPPPGSPFGGGFAGGGFQGGGGFADFSDFFASIFGADVMGGAAGGGRRSARAHRAQRGADHAAQIEVSLDELVSDSRKREIRLADESGATKTLDVTIPVGVTAGTKIRLAGQGGAGAAGAPSGDLLLEIALRADERFRVEGHDLRANVSLTPAEAALGSEVEIHTLHGRVGLKVPAGTRSGKTLRLRGQGLPKSESERGDLLVTLMVDVPQEPTDAERALYEQLRDAGSPPASRLRRTNT